MPNELELVFDKEKLNRMQDMLQNLSPQKQGGIIFRAFKEGAMVVERELKFATSGEILKNRTGYLSASIGSRVEQAGGFITATIGSGVRPTGRKRLPYANIHETGGIIKPRPDNPTGYLFIPIRAGSQYAISSGLWSYKRGPKKGQAKKGISFSSKILSFRMKKQVTIPARHYMSKTLARCRSKVTQVISTSITSQIIGWTSKMGFKE